MVEPSESVRSMLERIEKTCLSRLRLAEGLRLHGLDHLREVSLLAGQIVSAEVDGQGDWLIEAAMVAGFLHDVGREDDGAGSAHAHASADLAGPILRECYPHPPADAICNAIRGHADGQCSHDLLCGALWDADRLTLGRAGIVPRKEFFSTATARRMAGFDS